MQQRYHLLNADTESNISEHENKDEVEDGTGTFCDQQQIILSKHNLSWQERSHTHTLNLLF